MRGDHCRWDSGFPSADLENGTLSSVLALYKNLIHPQNTGNPQDTRMSRSFQDLYGPWGLYLSISIRSFLSAIIIVVVRVTQKPPPDAP